MNTVFESGRPGNYFLGDPYQVVDATIYKSVWENCKVIRGSFAVAIDPEKKDIDFFAVVQVASGNYSDNSDRIYQAESGSIGIVPESLWKKTKEDIEDAGLGTILSIKDQIVLEVDDDWIVVHADNTQIVISTKIVL